MNHIFKKIASAIEIQVTPNYIVEKSNPLQSLYVFTYNVIIFNKSQSSVQLISRYWRIRDAFGRIDEIEGPGVIGQQPLLLPQNNFEYSSFCPLSTEFGTMQGYYKMRIIDEEDDNATNPLFNVEIPTFQLVAPQAVN